MGSDMGLSRRLWLEAAMLPWVFGTVAAPSDTANAAPDVASTSRIYLEAGESPLLSIYMGKTRKEAVATRAAWLAAGHTLSDAVTPPSIVAGEIRAATLAVGDPTAFPTISFTYATGTPGLDSAEFTFLSPTGEVAYQATWTQGSLSYTKSGAITFANLTQPIALWSQPGKWTLSIVSVTDKAGNTTTYDAAQIAKIFTNTTYTVTNTTGLISSLAPHIISAKLANHVSLSGNYPLLKGEIDASAPLTGLSIGYIVIEAPGANSFSFYENVPEPLPIKEGELNIDTVFASTDPTGTWTITGFAACDYAMNCTGSHKASDIRAMFGFDTFSVTP